VELRPEGPDDAEPIRRVHRAAFDRPGLPDGPPEVALTDQLRASPEYIPAFSLVAEVDAAVVGHVIATRARLGPGAAPVLGLGPLGVLPAHQRQGVGQALMHAVIAATEEMGEPMIVLLGSPAYYQRFGFELSSAFGIDPPDPDWAPHFQVRPGRTYDPSLRGRFTYAEPFSRM
jgi:putative acetyltransferase